MFFYGCFLFQNLEEDDGSAWMKAVIIFIVGCVLFLVVGVIEA
jgi:hypothetical protein